MPSLHRCFDVLGVTLCQEMASVCGVLKGGSAAWEEGAHHFPTAFLLQPACLLQGEAGVCVIWELGMFGLSVIALSVVYSFSLQSALPPAPAGASSSAGEHKMAVAWRAHPGGLSPQISEAKHGPLLLALDGNHKGGAGLLCRGGPWETPRSNLYPERLMRGFVGQTAQKLAY